jgi:hypothetical protein
MLGGVRMVRVLVMFPLAGTLTDAGLKLHCTVVGWHESVTGPVKVDPLLGATVMVEVAGLPAGVVVGLSALAATVNSRVDAQAFANLVTSGDPQPVTWSYPTPALKPISVVPDGQLGVPGVHGTILFPVVTS